MRHGPYVHVGGLNHKRSSRPYQTTNPSTDRSMVSSLLRFKIESQLATLLYIFLKSTDYANTYIGLPPHVPDISTSNGLCDVIAVGMILEFSAILDRRRYETQGHKQSEDQTEFLRAITARRYFRLVMKTLYSQFATRIGDEWVHPMYIFKISLVKFAVALIAYRKNADGHNTPCTKKSLLAAIERHFNEDHKDLVPALKHYKDKNSDGWLTWSGPPIHIENRSTAIKRWDEGQEKPETTQHSLHRIYFDE